MEEFEFEIKRMMSGEAPADGAKVKQVGEEVVRAYERKHRKVTWLFYGYVIFLFVFLAFLLYQFFMAQEVKWMILYAVGVVIMYEGTVLMKLWYWVMDTKIATVRELKLVQLQLAELAAKVNAPAEDK